MAEVPGVKYIQNISETGYFWAKFDIHEPLVLKVTFRNPYDLYRGHDQDLQPEDFEEEL